MAESTLTKRALSTSFRTLLNEKPFSKISIGDICEKCDMNRKSFYYHYKDKYDLANSIFDTDFPFLEYEANGSGDNTLLGLCKYLYLNRAFYRRLLEAEGQNSFYDHLRTRLRFYFYNRLSNHSSFSSGFWADAVAFSIKEWLTEKKTVDYNVFHKQLISCIRIDNRFS
ncbi:MAG: TetR/AcrR family transcriptional regulator C-terminal domain-containing protein [Clostridia bacterium]|nr:TetR/AcrR family transcriptional regulator C-terminal domain-containing protein [Clostridia bacterium]